mmetsp:Transcript_23190/g.51577  ORF Transcript_23190/g.51577 Transcript_23190/m.51577 type:complete len:209 (-) Transcript_23190:547-1173(-)
MTVREFAPSKATAATSPPSALPPQDSLIRFATERFYIHFFSKRQPALCFSVFFFEQTSISYHTNNTRLLTLYEPSPSEPIDKESLFRFLFFSKRRHSISPLFLFFEQSLDCYNTRPPLVPDKRNAYNTTSSETPTVRFLFFFVRTRIFFFEQLGIPVNHTTTSRCISPPQTSPPSGPASPSSPAPTLSVLCPPVKRSLVHSERPSRPI